LRYAGGVGTGFSVHAMRELAQAAGPAHAENSSVVGPTVKGAVWTQPDLRAELRHASFKGLREES
jgi:ATP-dependent DNA ligase